MKGNFEITTAVYLPPIVSLILGESGKKLYTNSEVIDTKVQYLHIHTNSELDGTGSYRLVIEYSSLPLQSS